MAAKNTVASAKGRSGLKKRSVGHLPGETRGSAAAGGGAGTGFADAVAGEKGPRPDLCAKYVRKRLAAGLPEIVELLLKQSRAGDMASLKTLWQMAMLDKVAEKPRQRRSTFAQETLKRVLESEGVKTV